MSKKNPFLNLLLGFLIFSACENNKKATTENIASNEINISLNPEDKTPKYAKDIFKNVEFVPLQTLDECRIGKIDKMLTTENYYAILDRSSNAIYFFLKNGIYHHKIVSTPTQKMRIGNFDIQGDRVYLFDYDNRNESLQVFDLNGKRTGEEHYPQHFVYFKKTKGLTLFYNGFYHDNNSGEKFKRLSIYDKQGQPIKSIFSYDPQAIGERDLFDPMESFFSSGDNLFYAMPGISSFYEIDDKLTFTAYHINMPKTYQLPDDFLEDKSLLDKRRVFLTQKNKELIWNISNVYGIDNHFLSINIQSMDNLYFTSLCNLKTKKAINLRSIYYDRTTCKLPITEFQIIASDGTSFYGTYSAKFLLDILMKLGYDNIADNENLKDFVNHSNALSNPILTKFQMK
ncbi:6-bladed beta-propeller [Pedobacter sp. HDW13]|uniref:6-bladed beta-propeller n=1 Tax=unclassified Pedobacter TaxID=2628915 RepID=UPI000F59255E|nr:MULTISPECIES: 6-bladed beta-propeller [unclassified Pedobacter]QIL38181.1 6-bladed beta-propeller [Pedobacter sp. HDW13]RQO64397.1 hypothetical protein DBR40_25570 [Pedobacter sp. KBW01]